MTNCTVLILTYKGKHHLKHLLPTVEEAIKNSPQYNIEVLIVDNGKDEATKDFVQNHFPHYQFEFSPVNDYLFSLNAFVEKIQSTYTLILNDDMRLDKNVFNVSLPHYLNNNTLFAVNCRVLNWDGNGYQNHVRLMKYSKGWMNTYWAEGPLDESKYTLYGGGGSAFFRTNMYNQLRGFDNYYRPAYCEDLDLGHRAWKQGWASIIEPKALLYHRDGATIKEQYANQSDVLTQKIYTNQVKWMLRNVNYPSFKWWFYLLLPKRVLVGWITDKNSWVALIKGYFQYLRHLQRPINSNYPINDKQLIEKHLNKPYVY